MTFMTLLQNVSRLVGSQTQQIFATRTYSGLTALACTFIPSQPDFQVRHHVTRRESRFLKNIRGGGRPIPEGVIPPKEKIYGWYPVFPADGKYTTKPLPVIKMGGRDIATGRVVVKTIGGGHKKKYRWVDYTRHGNEDGSAKEERVFQVRYDPCRTARIALVASKDHKRWILASEFTKTGDLIKSCPDIPLIPVRPIEGNAYAIGALPIGSLIHNIEPVPLNGGRFCRAAGASAQYLRKVNNKCLVQLPSKQQILIDERCMVVYGRVSNVNHGSIPIGSPNRLRWLGHRPRSGLHHHKDGYCGRKLHPPKPVKDLLLERAKVETEVYELTYPTTEPYTF